MQAVKQSTGELVFSGASDLSGEVSLPKLEAGQTYTVNCASAADGPLAVCGTLAAGAVAARRTLLAATPASQNLRLFGHVALADGAVCGTQDEFFGLQTAATVTLKAAAGTTLSAPVRVK